ncbi:hypothetical protein EOI86_05150 [Hwanghaeella grinnelliae]|uniref:DUF4129 domain-containing protein n=1 Tax=Hwanghaeella grinnelliae TaxID=2500179 RepID=A0A3S2ZBC2_9PROT|nr:hypothetical protein [Hwanghaeella grinnelliae]RVU38665.1 hypothetical protein EOI86_05150 [Hwanghaeella grinnelliae]
MKSDRFSPFAATLLFSLCFPFLASNGLAQGASDPGAVAREILSNGPYQTELDLAKPREKQDLNWDWSWLSDLFSFSESMAPAMRAVLYVLLIAGICLILFAVFRGLYGRFRPKIDTDEEIDDDAGVTVRTRRFDGVGTLNDADALAEAGRYSEAVRVLMFRSLEFLRSGIGDALFPFLTSREILLVSGLDADERDALRRIVAAEEISHFGETLLNAEAYRSCRQDFMVFSGQSGEGTA